jgi:hypothetical protein
VKQFVRFFLVLKHLLKNVNFSFQFVSRSFVRVCYRHAEKFLVELVSPKGRLVNRASIAQTVCLINFRDNLACSIVSVSVDKPLTKGTSFV